MTRTGAMPCREITLASAEGPCPPDGKQYCGGRGPGV